MSDKEIERLQGQVKQLKAMLDTTIDTLHDERRYANSKKNRIPGGYVMVSREAEKNLRLLQRESPTGSLVFSVLREHMNIGTNAVTISSTALGKILGKSRATITRSISYLSKNNYVQIIKSGNINTYVVNEQIAFSGSAGQRTAVFSATVVAHECEQEEGWDKVKKLKATPLIMDDERVILGNEDLPPPDQKDLMLN